MTSFQDKIMSSALIASAVVVTLNVVAVTSGVADGFYTEIHNWITASM
ncbi:MAG: hypothetical protein OQK69_02515 [Gammaproteobacteria bacterium]|nr:hypothetical protein [Gammaproteobacteria bacterium]